MRRRRALIGCAALLAVPALLFAAVLTYLQLADLGSYRPTVEDIASDALGRELRIAGAKTDTTGEVGADGLLRFPGSACSLPKMA